MRTRIAPTPSGLLHAGNAMNFLLVDELARRSGAQVLLRIDDLDKPRVRKAYVEDIFRLLPLLGIAWTEGPRDEADFQAHWSQQLRLDRYHALIGRLAAVGATFACTCTRTSVLRCQCASLGLPLDTPGAVLRLRTADAPPVSARMLNGREVLLDPHQLIPEPVLRQRNGSPAYQVASLSDDIDMGIDLIVRGADLLPSTAAQLHMARELGIQVFLDARFVHHPLQTDPEERKLSKSQQGTGTKHLTPGPEELCAWRAWAAEQADLDLRDPSLRRS